MFQTGNNKFSDFAEYDNWVKASASLRRNPAACVSSDKAHSAKHKRALNKGGLWRTLVFVAWCGAAYFAMRITKNSMNRSA